MASRTSKLLHLNPSSALSLHFVADKGSKNLLGQKWSFLAAFNTISKETFNFFHETYDVRSSAALGTFIIE